MRILALARTDLRLTFRQGSAIFWIVVAPFLWVFLFGALSRPSDPTKTSIGLEVVRGDGSPLAARFVEFLKAENFGVTVIEPGHASRSGDREPIRSLTIPPGFGEAIAQRRKVQIDLHEGKDANPQGTFATQVALHKAIVRLLAGEAFGPLDPASDAVQVRSSWAGRRPVPAGYNQTIPGNLVMFVLIATLTYGAALLATERRAGILGRLAASPLRRGEILLGRLLGRAAIAAIQVAFFVAMGLTIFRIDWGSSPMGLGLVLVPFVLCGASLGLLGGTLFESPDAAAGVGIVLSLLMSALGGCWWPAEVMPAWLRAVARFFPSAWAIDGLHQIISWGGGVRDVLLHGAVLTAFAAGALLLAARRLRVAG